jgi:hypothetical protein
MEEKKLGRAMTLLSPSPTPPLLMGTINDCRKFLELSFYALCLIMREFRSLHIGVTFDFGEEICRTKP